jgi:putative tryptophan/tyrosine transport system substrate-binding protein
MRRRDFISVLGGAAVAWPVGAAAQAPEKIWRISHVLPAAPSIMGALAQSFEERLVEIGYVPSRDVIMLHQFSEPRDVEQTVVRLLPETDLLVIWTTLGATVAKKVTSTLPIVFLGVGAPVEWFRASLTQVAT